MHELAICGSIADIVKRRAADRQVAAVHLRIGQLRQIVPDTLAGDDGAGQGPLGAGCE